MKFRTSLLVVTLAALAALAGCSRDPRSLVATGNKYFDRGKYNEASIMYRRALQKDRKYADAWYRLGLVDMKQASYAEALGSFQRALQLDPSNADAAARLADLYYASYIFDSGHPKQSLDEARSLAKDLLRRNPRSFDGLRLAAYVALADRNSDEAIKDFEAANRVKPDQPVIVLALCQVLTSVNRGPEAEKLAHELIGKQKAFGEIYDFLARYYLSLKRPDDAEAVLKQKIANNPSVGPYLIELARFYGLTGRNDQMQGALNRLTSNTKSYPDAWMLAGDFWASAGQFDNALKAYSTGESVDPQHKALYQKRRAQLLLARGRTQEASQLIAEILKASPEDPEALSLRASINLRSGKLDLVQSAINDLGPLIGKYPNSAATPALHFNLGRAYVEKAKLEAGDPDPQKRVKDLEQARIQLEQTVQMQHNNTEARILLAEVQMDRGEFARVTQIADDILKTQPGNATARLLRTDALIRMHEYDKARTELNELVANNPNLREAWFQLAQLDIAQGNYHEAETLFQKAAQGGDPRAFIGLVEAKVQQGHFPEAIQMLSTAADRQPGNPAVRLALANVQVRAGKYDDAIGSFEKILNDNPKMPPAAKADLYTRIGSTERQKGDDSAALASFMKARQLTPNDVRPEVEIGMIYDQSGRKDMARAEYQKVLKLDPENVAAMNNLAFMNADQSTNLDDALALAQRARQKLPENIDVQDTLALVYIRKNLTDEGLRIMRDVVEKQPHNPTYRYHLALALAQKGDKLGARSELKNALAMKPSQNDQTRIRELMARLS